MFLGNDRYICQGEGLVRRLRDESTHNCESNKTRLLSQVLFYKELHKFVPESGHSTILLFDKGLYVSKASTVLRNGPHHQ